MQTAKCPFAKNRHAQKYVLRKSGFPKDVFAKILDIQDRGLRKIRVRSFSKDVFTHVLRKNRHAQKYVLRKSGFPKDVFAKILDIQDRGFAKDQGQILSQKMFLPIVLRKTAMPKNMFLRKSGFPKDVFAKILDIQDRGLRKIRVRSFSKDVPCLYVILKYIHNVCICDVAILYMMTGNHLFFFAKNLFSQKCWPQVAQIDRKMAAG